MRRPRKPRAAELRGLPEAVRKRLQWLEERIASEPVRRQDRELDERLAVWNELRRIDRIMGKVLRLKRSDLVRVVLKREAGDHPLGCDIWDEE